MNLVLDAFWRAAAYCLLPRVLLLSLLPLALLVVLALGLGFWFWSPAVEGVRAALESWGWNTTVWHWLDVLGLSVLKTVLPPLLVVLGVTPLLVMLTLLVVATLTTPAATALVASRRFAALERKQGGSLGHGLLWSLLSTVLALVALVVSLPLWLVPPLILVLPPLIWGWLTYRVMAYDVLADFASKDERHQLLRRHRASLLVMGVLAGYLGAAPGWIWATWAVVTPLFVVLVPLAVWIYTVVFVFASLWFAHFALAALQQLRAEVDRDVLDVEAVERAPFPSGPQALALQDELRSAGLAPPPRSSPD